MKALTIQDEYWEEILSLVFVLKSSDENGNHDLFREKLKNLKKKFEIIKK
jgi:hypothetical protein